MGAKYLLAGHSHAVALGLAYLASPPNIEVLPLPQVHPNFFGLCGGPGLRSDAYWDALVNCAQDTTVLIAWGGNQHLVHFLFRIVRSFDFFLSKHPEVPILSDADLIYETQVREILDGTNIGLKVLMQRLTQVDGCQVFLLGTPPPKGDDDRIRRLLSREEYFVGLAKQTGTDLDSVVLTERQVRRKLWLVVQDLLQEAADAHGCVFLPVPSRCMDDEGFLRDELWVEDATHANLAYGSIAWEEWLPKVVVK